MKEDEWALEGFIDQGEYYLNILVVNCTLTHPKGGSTEV